MGLGRQAIVVSFAGGSFYSPRVQRTVAVVGALEQRLDLRVQRLPVIGESQTGWSGGPFKRTLPRRAGRRVLHPIVLDDFELPGRLAVRGWRPDALGAILIGWPFSPLRFAASRLVAAGVPYVLDLGDPWALTGRKPASKWRLAARRAQAAERFLWQHAAGGIVTTGAQETSLRALFPNLRLLCRPNGYTAVEEAGDLSRAASAPSPELRLVQFGAVYGERLPIGNWLSRLRCDAGLERLTFVNYGPVASPELLQVDDPGVTVEVRRPIAWEEAFKVSQKFDAAVVVGNLDPGQLPSKAIQYLTLPIPRIAVVGGRAGNELARFATERPGYVAVEVGAGDDLALAIDHVRRAWAPEELAPPASDSWPEAATEVAEFAIKCWAPDR